MEDGPDGLGIVVAKGRLRGMRRVSDVQTAVIQPHLFNLKPELPGPI